MIKGRVSIIIPTYNRPRWLLDAIESVLNQTYDDVELIVVNDGSTDDTEKILEPYMDRIVYIYKENGGQGAAVNTGIVATTGEYIGRVDDDDLFVPEKTGLQVEMFEQNPELGLVAGYVHVIDADGKIKHTNELKDFSSHRALFSLLRCCAFSQPTVMVRRECYDRVGLYKHIFAEDYEMWIRIARHYPVGIVREPLAMYRNHDSNLSATAPTEERMNSIPTFISEALGDISMTELIPGISSIPHIYDLRGAIFLGWHLFKRAGQEFYTAMKIDPTNVLHKFWMGTLLRGLGKYREALECFVVPDDHPLYANSLKASVLTYEASTVDFGDGSEINRPEIGRLRRDMFDERDELVDTTIQLAEG